jgi:hypothetical protein
MIFWFDDAKIILPDKWRVLIINLEKSVALFGWGNAFGAKVRAKPFWLRRRG